LWNRETTTQFPTNSSVENLNIGIVLSIGSQGGKLLDNPESGELWTATNLTDCWMPKTDPTDMHPHIQKCACG